MRIAVFNSFDITPAQNGGEIRLLNLYRRLSREAEIRFLSYDLRCKRPLMREKVTPVFEIINTMVTDEDRWTFFQADERLARHSHDILCVEDYIFSVPFLREMEAAIRWADVIVVSHPFLAQQVFSRCSSSHLKIFEAHNVEIDAKASYLDGARDRVLADRMLRVTRRAEAYAIKAADLVLTVSQNDSDRFHRYYETERSKMHVLPNGVDVGAYESVSPAAKRDFRDQNGLAGSDIGVFLGSAYGPNVDSYRITRTWLDEAGFDGVVLLIGSIADARDDSWPPVNFREEWLGFVTDPVKHLLVTSADFAIQIMTSGGGTNLKLFDYMASGTPIIANSFGRRGVADTGWFIPVETGEEMRAVVANRAWHGEEARKVTQTAKTIVARDFDWNSIAKRYQAILA